MLKILEKEIPLLLEKTKNEELESGKIESILKKALEIAKSPPGRGEYV